MTETQRKFLTEYLGLIYHEIVGETKKGTSLCSCGRSGMDYWDICVKGNIHFDTAQDKQDLLEAIIKKNEWYSVVWDMSGELMESQSGEFVGFKNYAKAFLFAQSDSNESFTIKLIQLSPLETAELICRWKGVE